MNSRIADVVLFEQLADKDFAAYELLESINSVMLCADMEHGLVLVVSQLEVFLRAVEILLEHGHIIVLQSVVEGQVAVVVGDIGSRSNFINNRVLHLDTDDVLDGLAFIVLLATSLKEFVAASKPVEDVFIAVASADEKRVLTQVVLLLKGLVLVLFEDLKHLHVLSLNCYKKRALTHKVRL